MRSAENQLTIDFDNLVSNLNSNFFIIQQTIDKYNRLDQILNENSEIIKLVHDDLQTLSKRKKDNENRGRKDVYSTPTLLRALIIKKLENQGGI